MSEFVDEELIQTRGKPPSYIYLGYIAYHKKKQEDEAIERAKINDKKHKSPHKQNNQIKTIHWLDYRRNK